MSRRPVPTTARIATGSVSETEDRPGRRSRHRGAAVAQSRRRRRRSRRRAGASRRPGSAPSRRGRGAVPGRGQRRPEHLGRVLAGDERRADDDDRELGEDDAARPSARRRRPRRTGRSSRSEANHAVIPAISTAVVARRDERPALRAELRPLGAEGRSHESPRSAAARRPPRVLARAAREPEVGVLERGAGRLSSPSSGTPWDVSTVATSAAAMPSTATRSRPFELTVAPAFARTSSRPSRRRPYLRQSRPPHPRAARPRTRPRGDVRARSRSGGRRCPRGSLMRWLETKTVRPSAASVRSNSRIHWIPPGRGRWSARRGSGSAGRRGAPRRAEALPHPDEGAFARLPHAPEARRARAPGPPDQAGSRCSGRARRGGSARSGSGGAPRLEQRATAVSGRGIDRR